MRELRVIQKGNEFFSSLDLVGLVLLWRLMPIAFLHKKANTEIQCLP